MGQFCYDYPRPAVTTDCVVFGYDKGEMQVLLIERRGDPFKKMLALPGGFVDMDETTEESALRELKEETGIENIPVELLHTFSDVDRDPRGRTISVSYLALVNLHAHKLKAGDDASNAGWFPVTQLRALAFDHVLILNTALKRLKEKLSYQAAGFDLLPDKFTLPELQELYEKVLDKKFDRRNFRKKVLGTGLLKDQNETVRGVPHKGARLYKFDKARYRKLSAEGFRFEIT